MYRFTRPRSTDLLTCAHSENVLRRSSELSDDPSELPVDGSSCRFFFAIDSSAPDFRLRWIGEENELNTGQHEHVVALTSQRAANWRERRAVHRRRGCRVRGYGGGGERRGRQAGCDTPKSECEQRANFARGGFVRGERAVCHGPRATPTDCVLYWRTRVRMYYRCGVDNARRRNLFQFAWEIKIAQHCFSVLYQIALETCHRRTLGMRLVRFRYHHESSDIKCQKIFKHRQKTISSNQFLQKYFN